MRENDEEGVWKKEKNEYEYGKIMMYKSMI